jgi:hypothetical protein
MRNIQDVENLHVIFFFFSLLVEGGSPRGTAASYWPIVPVPGECEDGEVGGMKCGWQGKPKYSEKTCPSAILSTTNPICQTPGANASCRGGKLATNRLSYGAASKNLHVTRITCLNTKEKFYSVEL